MSRLADEIMAAEVPAGSIVIWWLGQAGFAFKTPCGKIVYSDPYLSDAVERLHGFKRLSLAPLAAADAQADLVVMTHEHTDHLDPDAIPVIARRNPQCRFAAPSGCLDGLAQAGVAAERTVILEPNRSHDLECVVVHTVPADHGDLSPTALSFLLDFDGIRVLITGDTSHRPALVQPLLAMRPDVLIPCINGVFGNMNHIDAAMLARQARPRFAIPCHFWTFAEQGAGDPAGFLYACRQFCPEVTALVLKPGEPFLVPRR
ncbi:MAG: MBL fold metallo-hydrolase [Isosphaeraceae bacterium]